VLVEERDEVSARLWLCERENGDQAVKHQN